MRSETVYTDFLKTLAESNDHLILEESRATLLDTADHIRQLYEEIKELAAYRTPVKPVRDSLSERGCPRCCAYIPFDALNDDVNRDAPRFCKNCGQAFDWSGEDGFKKEEY